MITEIKHIINSPYHPDESGIVNCVRWGSRKIRALKEELEGTTTFQRLAERVKRIFLATVALITLPFTLCTTALGLGLGIIKLKGLTQLPTDDYEDPEEDVVDEFQIDHRKIAQEELETKTPEELDANLNLLKYFPRTFVINLDKDTNRLAKLHGNLEKMGVDPAGIERFSAIYGRNLPKEIWSRVGNSYNYYPDQPHLFDKQRQGQAGCFMSHYSVIKKVYEAWKTAKAQHQEAQDIIQRLEAQGVNAEDPELLEQQQRLKDAKIEVIRNNQVCILEDDAQFGYVLDGQTPNTNKVGYVFRKVMSELPTKWNMFFFNAHVCRGSKMTDKDWVKKIDEGWDLGGYAIHSSYYEHVVKNLKKIEDVNGTVQMKPVDTEISNLMESSLSYTAVPPLLYQGGEESNINLGGDRNINYIQRRPEEWKAVFAQGIV